MDNQRFRKLQLALNPEIQIIVWVSEKPLDQTPTYFDELDYFLDQLLSELILARPNSSQESHFMMGSQFGAPLYLLHASGEQAQKHIDSMLLLLPKNVSTKVLYLGPAKKLHLPKQFQLTSL